METINKPKDVLHHVDVYFVLNTLPEAKKQFILRSAPLPYLNVREVATKAGIYGQNIDEEEMERYVNAYFNLSAYLVADGFGVENMFFRSRLRLPGEYEGYETSLPEGDFPEVRMNAAAGLRDYIREHVKLNFKGIDESSGRMIKFLDEASGLDNKITRGNLVHINGVGMKIASDEEHAATCGLWFVRSGSTVRTRATAVATNEPRTVVALVPAGLTASYEYYIEIVTQSRLKSGGLLKEPRTIRSDHAFAVL
jgi:hypothetical protein